MTCSCAFITLNKKGINKNKQDIINWNTVGNPNILSTQAMTLAVGGSGYSY